MKYPQIILSAAWFCTPILLEQIPADTSNATYNWQINVTENSYIGSIPSDDADKTWTQIIKPKYSSYASSFTMSGGTTLYMGEIIKIHGNINVEAGSTILISDSGIAGLSTFSASGENQTLNHQFGGASITENQLPSLTVFSQLFDRGPGVTTVQTYDNYATISSGQIYASEYTPLRIYRKFELLNNTEVYVTRGSVLETNNVEMDLRTYSTTPGIENKSYSLDKTGDTEWSLDLSDYLQGSIINWTNKTAPLAVFCGDMNIIFNDHDMQQILLGLEANESISLKLIANEYLQLAHDSLTISGASYTFDYTEIGNDAAGGHNYALYVITRDMLIPEPSTGTLSLIALWGIAARRRRV